MTQYLILGCGNALNKRITFPANEDHQGSPEEDFSQGVITTVDYTTAVNPDILANLNDLPYSWAEDGIYDEIHAYEILEHCGSQGDADFFFGQFNEFWRMLKPGGFILITVPMWNTKTALGVPDHRRVMPLCLFGFLEECYYDNVGKPGYGDYRHFIKGYWDFTCAAESEITLSLVLRKC